MALSDYSQADLVKVAQSLGALRGNGDIDYSKLSEAALRSIISRSANAIAGDKGFNHSADNQTDTITASSPREAAKANLKSVLDGNPQDIGLTQNLLIANGFTITLDDTLDDAERRNVEKLYTAYHKGMAAAEINRVAADANIENAKLSADKAAAAAAEQKQAASAESNIVSAKAGLVKLGYLPADTELNARWDQASDDALRAMQRDFSTSLQQQDGDAFKKYGNILEQRRAILGDTLDGDRHDVRDPQALAAIVGQVVKSAHPDISEDLMSGDARRIKLAQGVLTLNGADVKISGIEDHDTAVAANDYGAQGHDGIPKYLLNASNGKFDWAQVDAAAERGSLPIALNGLSEDDLKTYNELNAKDPVEARRYYADVIFQSGEDFYAKLLSNEAKPAPVPVPQAVSVTPGTMQPTPNDTPEVAKAINIYQSLPAKVPDDAPNSVKALVDAKNNWTNAQQVITSAEYNGEMMGIIGMKSDLAAAENNYLQLQESYTASGQIKEVEAYLRGTTPDADPADPKTTPKDDRTLVSAFDKVKDGVGKVEDTPAYDALRQKLQGVSLAPSM